VSGLLRVVAAVVLVGLLYAGFTAVVPVTGLEGLLLLTLLITVTGVVARLARRRLANH
jgi:hypothetical protein